MSLSVASCCADCATHGLPHCEPIGYISTHGAYFSPSPNIGAKDERSERAILLLADDPLENSRILADNLAMRLDCDVWVPDYHQGPPMNVYPHPDLLRAAGAHIGVRTWLRAKLHKTLLRIPLSIKNRPTMIDARLYKVCVNILLYGDLLFNWVRDVIQFIKALQEENDYSKIGVVGYCSGGSTAIRLASTEWVQSVVICHPGKIKLPEVRAIKVPSAWICAEDDRSFSKTLRSRAEAHFRRRRDADVIEYEFEDYRGTKHGFACRPDLTRLEMKEAYEKAFEQTVRWFTKTLPT